MSKDWGVLYFCPRPGSAQLKAIIEGNARAMDQYRYYGIYSDEFSWAGNQRGYSRYDYSRWDGYSAELDDNGKPVRLKADNAYMSESCQLRVTDEVLRRGKFFLGNGGNALRSLSSLPIQRFVEGGNGPSAWPQGHLSAVPLILGNMGDEKTTQGVFESVRAGLELGSVYSPTAVNLLLDGPDNFVSKLYPISVQELGPGWVIGRERLMTTVSRSFNWPVEGGKVKLYRYDALFLTMPISWKGTLAQYAGRLHRLHDQKTEVLIYDYADLQVPVLARMHAKRVKGYEAIGYRVQRESDPQAEQPRTLWPREE